MKTKHFNWSITSNSGIADGKGRIAVGISEQRFAVMQAAGNAPHVAILDHIMDHTPFGNEIWNVCLEQNDSRKNPWFTREFTGMSGATDYVLFEVRDEGLRIARRAAGIHVSMYNKLNGGIDMWPGDFRILYHTMGDYAVYDGELWVEEIEDFYWPETIRAAHHDPGSTDTPVGMSPEEFPLIEILRAKEKTPPSLEPYGYRALTKNIQTGEEDTDEWVGGGMNE